MTYDEAMKAAETKTVALPRWQRIGVKMHKGRLRIVDENDTPGEVYRPLPREKASTDWDIRK